MKKLIMANPWFKFYGGEFLADPKMLALSACARSCWITLLSYASQSDGTVKHLTEDRLMMQSGLDPLREEWKETEGVLKQFESLEMIRIDKDVITVLNWEKRQESYLSNAERQAKHRGKKAESNAPSYSDVTKVTLDKNRIDKNREDNITAPQGDAGVKEVISSYKSVNPAYDRLFKRKVEIDAAKQLLKVHGRNGVLLRISRLKKTNTMPFFPVILTPLQTYEKWGAWEAAYSRHEGPASEPERKYKPPPDTSNAMSPEKWEELKKKKGSIAEKIKVSVTN